MALQHKRIITAGGAPTTGQVSEGEIVINLADGEIFTETDTAAIKSIGIGRDILNSAITQAKLDMNPVGSIVLRLDAINPSTIFGGTWSLLPASGSLASGDGTAQTGVIVGFDDKDIPVPEHSHANTVAHTISASQSGHTHRTVTSTTSSGGIGDNGIASRGQHSDGEWYTLTGSGTANTGLTDAVAPAITVAGGVSITNALAGTAGATINVAGAELIVNAWQRTA